MGTLYLVATPIGNLEDISQRALNVLRTSRLIAAEDTRVTRRLLSAYDIHTPLTSYYEHNKLSKLEAILANLDEGPVALVSDAGTPGLNDPGFELVRAALGAGHNVIPVPGPSAPVSALVASGLPTDAFLYLGYLPRHAAERRKLLEEVSGLPYTLIFLEAPHRLVESLSDLAEVLGSREAAVARELTKLHEEVFRGSLEECYQHYLSNPPRGEITLVIHGQVSQSLRWEESRLDQSIGDALAKGESARTAAREIAEESGWSRREIYRRIIDKHLPS